MQCEICGKNSPLKKAIIEGTDLFVCPECQKFGTEKKEEEKKVPAIAINVVERLEKREKKLKERDIFEGREEELVDDYSHRVRNARVKMNISIEDFGKKINEKKTVIAKVESGEMIPTDELVKKLERELNIKLMEKPQTVILQKKAGTTFTIGDLIKIKKVKE